MSDRERSSPTLIESGLKTLIGGRDSNYPLISGINVSNHACAQNLGLFYHLGTDSSNFEIIRLTPFVVTFLREMIARRYVKQEMQYPFGHISMEDFI
uniref:Uncharacterized protein n=1 Tax=Lutzomyia longipalpis TaxID=7200 RepID=A0A1B0GJI8_LUTLO